jgi:hypothetical protein
MEIFIAPASSRKAQQNINRTVRTQVSFDSIKHRIRKQEVVSALTDARLFGVWGLSLGGNESTYDHLSTGDIVAFYVRQRIEFVGEVLCKDSNPGLANLLWPYGPKTYSLIFFMKLKNVDIPFEMVRNEIGYKANFVPLRFQRVILRKGRTTKQVIAALKMRN